ncbi:MAG: translation initiation factor IF-3 [Bacilli bacterium]|nr:translation initiation factor IF-3 [Bacilli bacterium]
MNKKSEFSFRINDEIRNCDNVRIVGDEIESKVVSFEEAMKLSNKLNLDLVEINPKANPPIVRLCNYEKFIYDLKKNKKKTKPQSQLKEVQLSVTIAKHDLETKAGQARKFLEQGDKVKAVLTMRGRELNRREENKKSILEFIVMLEDCSAIESLRDEGNKTIVILKKKK